MASETNDIVAEKLHIWYHAEKLHIWYHGGKSAKKSPETRMIPNFRTYYEVKANGLPAGILFPHTAGQCSCNHFFADRQQIIAVHVKLPTVGIVTHIIGIHIAFIVQP